MTTRSPDTSDSSSDANSAPSSEPPPAESGQGPNGETSSPSQFPHADDDFGLTPKPKADQQAKTQRVDPLLGMDLGGVKIVKLLGEGGMGRVYEAEQTSPPRTVAVKVIRQGITSDKTMRRFEREAEFLGKLQHPGIAQIYVVGSYASDFGDVPFFVMELIPNAKPITNYAHERHLPLLDRLRLFKHVCEAVSHGHDRGIVHRDLKPGNILIASDGKPKVIDFGVARSTDSDLTLTNMRTDTGALVGTVQYMSPEQFGDSSAEGLDGRADVYSLGVVLYEMLAGGLPYEVRKRKMHEAARIVCEHIPPTLRARDRSIPRDVSLLAERCLQKDRRGRYQTAGELAADVQRILDGKPLKITARGWLACIRQRLMARFARPGILGLTVATCLGLALMVRAFVTPAGSTPAKSDGQEIGVSEPPVANQLVGTGAANAQGQSVPGPVEAKQATEPPPSLHDELWALLDENLAAMTAHDIERTLATMSREMPEKDLFISQCKKEWARAGMHYRLDAVEIVERDDWPPPYAVALVTMTIRDPTPGALGDKLPPDPLSDAMLLRTKVPTTRSEWLFKREVEGWKIVATLSRPEPAAPPTHPAGPRR